MSFKQSVGDPHGSLSNWNYSHENPCSWNGVSCKEQKVIAITIQRSNLQGFLHSSLGRLSNLRHVNLRNNNFFGKLPSELFGAEGLQSLVLSGNSFSGYLPPEIGGLKYLQNLDLSQNFFNGTLPTAICQCQRLRALDLSQNNLTGSFPGGFGTNLVSLEKLDLSFNQFTGPVPSDLGSLSNLQGTLGLSHNSFSGLIPSSLGNLPEKVYIDLSYNNLSGPIPQNGTLINEGPTAFMGNPGLCGPPLRIPCPPGAGGVNSPALYPYLPGNYPPGSGAEDAGKGGNRGGLSKRGVIAIIACDVIGIVIVGLLFSYCYSRKCFCRKREDENACGIEKGEKGRVGECFCFRKDDSETLSENAEQSDLVPLDTKVAFNLDELLKASAFVLGKSGIGIVYRVVLEGGLNLAVRRLGEGGSQRFKEFQTEVEAIGKLRHSNIVTLRAYYWSGDEKLLIYDYLPKGNLATAIHGKPGMVSFTPLSWSIRVKIMRGIAKGLVYLHEFSPKKYVHGDLKPSNILLGQNMEPQISDFGLGRLANIAADGSPTVRSNRMTQEKTQQGNFLPDFLVPHSLTIVGGSHYQAPEAVKAVKPSQKWDVYSFGVILIEMITGRCGASEVDVVHWVEMCIQQKKPLRHMLDPYLINDTGNEEEIIGAVNIALTCVHSNPERRPGMRHVSDALERLSISN